MSVKTIALSAAVVALTGFGAFTIHATSEVTKEVAKATGGVVAAAEVYNAPAPEPTLVGYNDSEALSAEIKTQITASYAKEPALADATVTGVICVATHDREFDCALTDSQLGTSTYTYVVAEDGQSFIAKAGQ